MLIENSLISGLFNSREVFLLHKMNFALQYFLQLADMERNTNIYFSCDLLCIALHLTTFPIRSGAFWCPKKYILRVSRDSL